MERIDGLSMDLEKANLDKLREVFPEVFSEGKLDITKLLDLCGEYDIKDFEHYKFEWKGKSECLQIAQRRSIGTLRPKPDESVNFADTKNLYIKGDNLEVLKLLQASYYRRVKMIYIDPPYNTGNDFVYNDDFSDPIEHYKQVVSQATRSNPETMGQFHTKWLNMMYPRLRLAATLLRDDGVCFISIDETEHPNLRKVCDEVFGEENHVADFVWHNKRGGGNDAKHVAVEHEYVIMYAKNILELQELFVPYSPDYLKRYKEEDENGKFFWDTFKRKSGKQYYPITCPDGTVLENDELGNPLSWLRSESRFKADLDIGDVRIIKINDNWSVQFKQRLPEGKKPRTIFLEDSIFDNQGTTSHGSAEVLELFEKNLFNNPKPIGLLKHLLNFDLKNDEIVIDFFSGSATTAHAVMQLNAEDNGNRRFIMVQLPEITDEKSEAYKAGYKNICDIGMERIRRAGAKILEEYNSKQSTIEEIGEETKVLDVGFKVFELDTSNLKTFNGTPMTKDEKENTHEILIQRLDEMDDQVKPNRTDLDMVYEIMLKIGFTLDMEVTTIQIQGKTVHVVDDYLLLIYLDTDITVEIAEELIDLAPGILIIGEDAFNDDMSIMANIDYFCQNKGVRLQVF